MPVFTTSGTHGIQKPDQGAVTEHGEPICDNAAP
jgi:hypothetical protein